MDALEEIYADYPAILMSRDPERITQAVDRIADRTDPAAKAMSDLLGSVRKHLSGDYRSAHGAAASAKARYKELGDDRGVIRSNIQLLMCLHALGDYTTSLELNHENLRLNEAVQDDNVTGGSYNSIGLVYRETGDYPAAIEYLE